MKEAYEYAAPQRETFFDYVPGQQKNTDIFDDTAIVGTQTFSNRMQKVVVPPWQRWSVIVPGTESTEEDRSQTVEYRGEQQTLEEALHKVTGTVFNYIHQSNFASRINEAFIDLAISTGTVTCEYSNTLDKLVFNAIPLPQLFLAGGPDGEIADHWREHEVDCGLITQMWPEAKLDEETKQVIADKPGTKMVIIEGCIYHEASYYYVVMLAKTKSLIFSQDEGETGPFISFRGMVTPGEIYGRGPVMQVLNSIKTLNVMSEFELTSAAIAASGAWTGRDDGVFNPYTIQIAPGILIPVASNDTSNPTVAALPMNFDFESTFIKAEELKGIVNKALFSEPLGDVQDPTKTLGEMQMRYQMYLEDSGAFFARIQTELVEKLMKRVVFVLQREGVIPPITLDGKDVGLKHTSPIARVMDGEDIQNLQSAMEATAMLGEQAVMMTYDTEKVGEYIAQKRGVDPDLYRDEKQREALKKQLTDMAAQQAQAQARAGDQPQEGPPNVAQ